MMLIVLIHVHVLNNRISFFGSFKREMKRRSRELFVCDFIFVNYCSRKNRNYRFLVPSLWLMHGLMLRRKFELFPIEIKIFKKSFSD